MNRRERRAAARKSPAASDGGVAVSPDALYRAGLLHLQAGRQLDAQMCCRKALAADPNHAETLHLMGVLALRAEQPDLAVEWIARAIRHDPQPRYLSTLGNTLQIQRRFEEALKAFDKAIQLKPDDAKLWSSLGKVLIDLSRVTEALRSLEQALTLDPRNWDAADRSAYLFYQQGRFEEALKQYDLCLELQPNNALALQMRAASLRGLKRFEESLADNLRSHELAPDNIETLNNIGDALRALGRYEEAVTWFDRAIARRPSFVLALINKGSALVQLRRLDEAIATLRQVKALDPGNAEADWNLSLLELLIGDFEAGWARREARWNSKLCPDVYPRFAEPMWLGVEPVEGKTILVHVDEGLGDTIQFVRYVPMLAERGARVILVVATALHSLLSKFPGVSECLVVTDKLPPFDMHCPICSLPFAFGTRLDTIPAATPYLPGPTPEQRKAWEDRLGPHDRLRVGLVWSGSPNHANDLNRSIPLQMLSGILDIEATFVSLQKDPRAADKALLERCADIVDLATHLADFVETAALVSCLDLVITVDTSVAHLAGALGRPTWILLPYVPDYRWMLDRGDSPWYPTVRLFRQTATREYHSVLEVVRNELLALVSSQCPPHSPSGFMRR
jgi:tetratricopeptide (TPR) repeat protein